MTKRLPELLAALLLVCAIVAPPAGAQPADVSPPPTITFVSASTTGATYSVTWTPVTPAPDKYTFDAGFNDGSSHMAGDAVSPLTVVFAYPLPASGGGAFVCVAAVAGGLSSRNSCNGVTVPPPPSSNLGKLTLGWTLGVVTGNNAATSQNIERRLQSATTYPPPIASVGPTVTGYVDSSVTQGAAYCYRLNAQNSAGVSPYSNEACGTVPLAVSTPGVPTGLRVQ